MVKKYTRDRKERMVAKINKLTKKEHFIKVFKIIQENENKPTKEIGDSMMMFFHDLKNETYEEIDKFLKTVQKKEKKNDIITDDYKPYSNDEFPHNKDISPKLKYSNKEKNLIKRKRYDQNLMEENGSDVVYCKFNVETITETDATDGEKN